MSDARPSSGREKGICAELARVLHVAGPEVERTGRRWHLITSTRSEGQVQEDVLVQH